MDARDQLIKQDMEARDDKMTKAMDARDQRMRQDMIGDDFCKHFCYVVTLSN